MEVEAYQIEHEIEGFHWWFIGRRFLFKSLISKLNLTKEATILDIGSSAGSNLRLLKQMNFRFYSGLDISPQAQYFCNHKQLGQVLLGDIQEIKLPSNHFDLILLTDVLEHLAKEEAALMTIWQALKPGGHLLLTVPCFPALWGPQDRLAHHLRRYRKCELEKKIKKHNFKIIKSFYFNFFLFLPIFLSRKFLNFFHSKIHENKINSKVINFVLKGIFLLDCFFAQRTDFPFGVSALIIAEK